MVFLHDYISRLIFNAYYENGMERSRKSHVFSAAINLNATAHRFSPLEYPSSIEAAFFPKTNTFTNRRKEVIPWRYFALRKPATTR